MISTQSPLILQINLVHLVGEQVARPIFRRQVTLKDQLPIKLRLLRFLTRCPDSRGLNPFDHPSRHYCGPGCVIRCQAPALKHSLPWQKVFSLAKSHRSMRGVQPRHVETWAPSLFWGDLGQVVCNSVLRLCMHLFLLVCSPCILQCLVLCCVCGAALRFRWPAFQRMCVCPSRRG